MIIFLYSAKHNTIRYGNGSCIKSTFSVGKKKKLKKKIASEVWNLVKNLVHKFRGAQYYVIRKYIARHVIYLVVCFRIYYTLEKLWVRAGRPFSSIT